MCPFSGLPILEALQVRANRGAAFNRVLSVFGFLLFSPLVLALVGVDSWEVPRGAPVARTISAKRHEISHVFHLRLEAQH